MAFEEAHVCIGGCRRARHAAPSVTEQAQLTHATMMAPPLLGSSVLSRMTHHGVSKYYKGPRRRQIDCYCFSICSEAEAEAFTAMLPIVHGNESSPSSSIWYKYLHEIYGEGLSLPFDMSKLQFFYTELLPPLRLGSRCRLTLPRHQDPQLQRGTPTLLLVENELLALDKLNECGFSVAIVEQLFAHVVRLVRKLHWGLCRERTLAR